MTNETHQTWHDWFKKHYADLNLNNPEDYGMLIAFAVVETRLRRIGQYGGNHESSLQSQTMDGTMMPWYNAAVEVGLNPDDEGYEIIKRACFEYANSLALTWRIEKPDCEGWWWVVQPGIKPAIVRIKNRRRHDNRVCLHVEGDVWQPIDEIVCLGAQWAGPIPLPQDTMKACGL